MINDQTSDGPRRGSRWRIVGWGFAVFLLVMPFVAMQLTSEVNWTAGDFVFAAVLFGSVGLAIEFLVRRSGSASYRWGAVVAVLTAFLTIWVNAAVGMIGSENNDHNMLFVGVVLLALLGSIVVRFKPNGMAMVMIATAAAQVAIAAAGLPIDARGATLGMGFALPWLLAAILFRAARQRRAAGGAA